MAEGGTCSETLRAGNPVTVGSFTLLPIARVVLHAQRHDTQLWLSAAIEPYAVVVRDAGGVRAIAVGAAAVSLDALREQIPGLESVLVALGVPQP